MAGTGIATVDFGATPVDSGTFTISDAGVAADSFVECFMMQDTTADNSATEHQTASASFRLSALPGTGSFQLDICCLFGLCDGEFSVRYVYTP